MTITIMKNTAIVVNNQIYNFFENKNHFFQVHRIIFVFAVAYLVLLFS